MRVSLLNYKMPELSGKKTGVFSKLPHHDPDEGRRYFETTYFASFQKKFDNVGFIPKSNRQYMQEGGFSGTLSSWKPTDKKDITTQLISEKYNTGNEPKYNTEIQRTWINYRDPGIRAVQDLGVDNRKYIPLPKIDNNLSLRIQNEKEYSKQRNKSFFGCHKTFSDITKTTYHITNLRKY